MTIAEIFEKVMAENERSKQKYGSWAGKYTPSQQAAAAIGEFSEWYKAFLIDDMDGPHGEIIEAIQTINCLCRRIQFITGEFDA